MMRLCLTYRSMQFLHNMCMYQVSHIARFQHFTKVLLYYYRVNNEYLFPTTFLAAIMHLLALIFLKFSPVA